MQTERSRNHSEDEIAQLAARFIVEDGMEYAQAKRHAAQQLRMSGKKILPDNQLIEDAVREYISIFMPEQQKEELRILREKALMWMRRVQDFRPYLTGSVWRGTATFKSDIYIQLFCDDSKLVEIHFIDIGVQYDSQEIKGFNGQIVTMLTVHDPIPSSPVPTLLHFVIYDENALRNAPKKDEGGLSMRGNIEAVERITHETEGPTTHE